MKAMVVVCHPDPGSFNHALSKAVCETWESAGCELIFHDLYAEGFDPLLTARESHGFATNDPMVRAHIAELTSCNLLGIVHPNCWGAPPAMMKGWIDRVFAPEAAYAFEKNADNGDVPIGLLKKTVALVLNTGNTPQARERDHFGDPLDQIWRQCVLNYCGVGHVERRLFGVVATSSVVDRMAWLDEARHLALMVQRRAATPDAYARSRDGLAAAP